MTYTKHIADGKKYLTATYRGTEYTLMRNGDGWGVAPPGAGSIQCGRIQELPDIRRCPGGLQGVFLPDHRRGLVMSRAIYQIQQLDGAQYEALRTEDDFPTMGAALGSKE